MKTTTLAPKRSFALTKPQIAYLTKEAKRHGITLSDSLRRILDAHLERIKEAKQ